jgi:hypothetical protein
MWPSKSKTRKLYMHFTMLGFAPNSISCILVTTYFLFTLQGTTPRLCLSVRYAMPLGKVCSWELPYLAITSSAQTPRRAFGSSSSSHARGRQGTQIAFDDSSSSHARGLDATRHSVCLWWLVRLPFLGLAAEKKDSTYLMRFVWLPCFGAMREKRLSG